MSKGIRFRNKNNEHIYPCPYMPIGSIFKSTSSTNPSTYFDGTWVLVHSGYERQQIGSQVIYPDISGSGNVSKTNLIGAYSYETISGIFDNISIP
ncbi:MAG: phage baseplate protein, partial [Bacilli bacterium]